jgi:hypothetical protein
VSTIFELIDSGDAAAVREAIAAQPDVVSQHDEQGLSVVMRAAYRGGEVFDVVRSANPPLEPFDRIVVGESSGLPRPDAWTPDGFTPLHIAAFANNVDAARELLDAGADPNVIATASFARVTPLGTCAFAGAGDVARVLLDHGADPTIAEDGVFTPLDAAVESGNDEVARVLQERAR